MQQTATPVNASPQVLKSTYTTPEKVVKLSFPEYALHTTQNLSKSDISTWVLEERRTALLPDVKGAQLPAHSKHHDQYDCNPEGKGGWRITQIPIKARNYSNGKENSTVLTHAAEPRLPYMGKWNASSCWLCFMLDIFSSNLKNWLNVLYRSLCTHSYTKDCKMWDPPQKRTPDGRHSKRWVVTNDYYQRFIC